MAFLLVAMSMGLAIISDASPRTAAETKLSPSGKQLEKKYSDLLEATQERIARALPRIDDASRTALHDAREATKAAETAANAAQKALSEIQTAKALVDHAKGKWIGGAEKGIAQAEAALKKASTPAEREAAQNDLAKWQANKNDGIKALKERQKNLDRAKTDGPRLTKANEAARAALAKARSNELTASKALLGFTAAFLSSDRLDAELVKATVLTDATPRGLAAFAQQGREQETLVEKLLASDALMKQMLEGGGAKFGQYGRATEIYAAIRSASPKADEGTLLRLALATSLEHAVPIVQSNPVDQPEAPGVVDPVNRYLHYERAFLAGELDPAFENLAVWEYRLVVNCDAPDGILAWGREMLRNYRPDHIYNPDYGWRYVSTIRTEVPYGSQNVKDDLPSLHKYQNIIRNGGVCGRRAFFGRFLLRSFGIPVWGVTQYKHAALSHWTPKGWVVNLGAGFEHSWWDKDELPRSGSDFLLETQARAHPQDYLKVLRAQWISRVLGETAHNDRKGVVGGFWSGLALDQAAIIAAKAVDLGPLGQELAEANESKKKQSVRQKELAEADQTVVTDRDGVITIPALAHGNPSGPSVAMKSYSGGTQLHCTGGFTTDYKFKAPRAGRYALSARVATAQAGQKFQLSLNDPKTPIEIDVPYTIGMWLPTQAIEVSLGKGRNVLHFKLQDGSRGVTIKEFILTPLK
jgi:hypothetical protein